ncbi:hypothetical protein HHK36_020527 [Tetracentron sinense]|uniref:40S ribosomal protein S15 n=1 Tax=Tetracentron sinense TaxID=13715 RepID=A0A834YVK1_TETSI|nr:hypothetical protein HHK36_020527 [Tetracentron sinense]
MRVGAKARPTMVAIAIGILTFDGAMVAPTLPLLLSPMIPLKKEEISLKNSLVIEADPEIDVAAGQPKRRTFKKFSFRGVDLDALLDMSTDELVKLFNARARRRFQRGLKRKPMALIKKLRKAGSGDVSCFGDRLTFKLEYALHTLSESSQLIVYKKKMSPCIPDLIGVLDVWKEMDYEEFCLYISVLGWQSS